MFCWGAVRGRLKSTFAMDVKGESAFANFAFRVSRFGNHWAAKRRSTSLVTASTKAR
jgi:hypothetical protein